MSKNSVGEKLDQTVAASEKVRARIRGAIRSLNADTHTNGYGELMMPRMCRLSILAALGELNAAMAIIDTTQWLTDAEYDQL